MSLKKSKPRDKQPCALSYSSTQGVWSWGWGGVGWGGDDSGHKLTLLWVRFCWPKSKRSQRPTPAQRGLPTPTFCLLAAVISVSDFRGLEHIGGSLPCLLLMQGWMGRNSNRVVKISDLSRTGGFSRNVRISVLKLGKSQTNQDNLVTLEAA